MKRRSPLWWILPVVLLLGLCCCGGAGAFAYDEWGADWYEMRQRRDTQQMLGTPQGWERTGVREQGGTIDELTVSYRVSCSQRSCRSDEEINLYQWLHEAGVQNLTTSAFIECMNERARPGGPGCRWDGTRGGFQVRASTPGWEESGGTSTLTAELVIGGRA